MLRLLVLNQEQLKALADYTNLRVLEALVEEEMNATQLSERLGLPVATVWRRLNTLAKLGLVEVARIERRGNFRVKFYRARALRYSLPVSPALTPKDEGVREVFRVYLALLKSVEAKVLEHNEVPEGVDPVDYSVALDFWALASTILENEEAVRGALEKAERFLFSRAKGKHKSLE